jgi:hypothetical protein
LVHPSLRGIDKRIFIIALIGLALVLPVFPRERIIYVDGQTLTTQTIQSTTYVTSLSGYSTVTQQNIPVYVGTIQYVQSQYYGNWGLYCYRWRWQIICYNYGWPGYNSYGTANIDPGMMVTRIDRSAGAYGLEIITLYRYDGTSVGSFSTVVSDNLAMTGQATVNVVVSGTNTITNTISNQQTKVYSIPCQKCIPQTVMERVSILWILLGL